MKIEADTTGKVPFRALGRDWVFVLNFKALAALDRDNPGLMSGVSLRAPSVALTLFTRGLQDETPTATEDHAAAIIDEIGLDAALAIIVASTKATYAKPMSKAKGGAQNPQSAAGTGESS